MTGKIRLDIQVEDLASEYPEAVGFLMRRGIRCIRCGEPVWGTLAELLDETDIENPETLVADLNVYLQEQKKSG